jgi:hypothetical protein
LKKEGAVAKSAKTLFLLFSNEVRFKGVNLAPKEKVPAKPGNTVVLEQSEVLRFSDKTDR